MGDGVYAIAGGKGGVGKTTTAINLGVVLGQAGYEVVVVDADLAMPDVGRQLHVDHERGLHGVLAEETLVRDAVVEGPGGLAVVPGDRDLASFADANPDRLREVFNLLGIAYDVVLVDTAPGLQNESVITYQEVDGVVLVTTPEPNAVADMEKTGQLAGEVGADLLGGAVTHGEGQRAREAASELDSDLLAVVPHHTTGGPITAEAPDDAAADAYRRIAAALPAVDATAVVPDGTAEAADSGLTADRSGTEADGVTAGRGTEATASNDTVTDGTDAGTTTDGPESASDESTGDGEADEATAETDGTTGAVADTDRDGTVVTGSDDVEDGERIEAASGGSGTDEGDGADQGDGTSLIKRADRRDETDEVAETGGTDAGSDSETETQLAAEIPRARTTASGGSTGTTGNAAADDEADVLELVDDAVEKAQDVAVDHVDDEIESATDEGDGDEQEASPALDDEPETFERGSDDPGS